MAWRAAVLCIEPRCASLALWASIVPTLCSANAFGPAAPDLRAALAKAVAHAAAIACRSVFP